jgi:hypothetical protein
MNSGRFALSQLLDLVDRKTLSRLVVRYDAESRVRHFGCRQQLICMAFAQLTWEQFLDNHNPRYEAMAFDLTQGIRAKETAARYGRSSSWVDELKEKLAGDLREYFGEQAIADSMQMPSRKGNVRTEHEKAAFRADRRRG